MGLPRQYTSRLRVPGRSDSDARCSAVSPMWLSSLLVLQAVVARSAVSAFKAIFPPAARRYEVSRLSARKNSFAHSLGRTRSI